VWKGSAMAEQAQSEEPVRLSDELERWLDGDGDKTVGGLIDLFGEKSFALLFVLLLAVPALPLPTGGATHVFEVIAVLTALQLVANRGSIWLPERLRKVRLGGEGRERFTKALLRLIRRLERISRPRFAFLLRSRVGRTVFGLLVIGGCVGAFLAPPFSGLDTLPALGVVVLSLGFLLEDILIAAAGVVLGAAGVVLEIVLGEAAVHFVSNLI
jgi:hypothetical protein